MAVPGSNEGASGRRTAGEGDSPGHDDTPSDFATLYTVGHSTRALGELITMGRSHRTAIMCAEAVPWRCHRSLIADALVIRGVHVIHILDEHASRSHQMTPWAQVEGLEITYPAKP